MGHDAFGYMEKNYGFRSRSISGIFAHSKPNAAKIAELIDWIESENIRYIFTDPIESDKSASQLAADTGLKKEDLYAVGNIPINAEEKGEDMITLLYFDLQQLRKGLECR